MRWHLLAGCALFSLSAGCAFNSQGRNGANGASTPSSRAAQAAGDEGPEAIYQTFKPAQIERITAVEPIVAAAANEYDLEPELIYGVIWVESRFQPQVKSSAGARGLMQLMPATASALAKQMGVGRPRSYDPEFNVMAGSFYLRRLIDRFDGDERLALAAYHAGAGNVNKWLAKGDGLPDFSQKYVSAVFEARARFRGTPMETESAVGTKSAPTPDTPAAKPKPSSPIRKRPQPDPEKKTPEPVQADEDEREVEDEPTFIPRPDLDRDPPKTRPESQRPEPTKRRPPESSRQRPRPSPRPGPAPDVGLGVLPGVDE